MNINTVCHNISYNNVNKYENRDRDRAGEREEARVEEKQTSRNTHMESLPSL